MIGKLAESCGDNCVGVGYNVQISGNWCIAIGSDISIQTSGTIVLGTKTIAGTALYIGSIYDTALTAGPVALYADNTGKIGYVASSIRYKENIRPYASLEVFNLRPVTFDYKDKIQGTNVLGLIADEVVQHIPEVVCPDANGDPETVNYEMLAAPIVAGIKHLKARLDAAAIRIAALESA
jgi:hypothetical protein